MSIQGVPVSKSAGKFPKFTFHLIKSAVIQTRTCRFSWFSGGLCESDILKYCSAILSYSTPCTDAANIDVLVANQIADILVALW